MLEAHYERFVVPSPPLIAVRIPCMIASGVGGQPSTATSKGITFDTRPQLA